LLPSHTHTHTNAHTCLRIPTSQKFILTALKSFQIYDDLRSCNFENDVLRSIPSAVDHARTVELCSRLKDFDVVSKLLQMDGQKAMDLDDVRVQFDMLIQKHPGAAYHLSADAAIVQNKNFEKGVVKLQQGNEHELTAGEKIQLRRFLKEDAPAEDGDEEDDDDDDEEEEGGLAVAQRLHDRNQARKRARIMRTSSKYRSTKHVCSTTNMVERLFSRAKLVMTDLRRRCIL
jgi:hypothetical protein